MDIKTVGDLKEALKEHDDDTPIGVWSWVQFGNDFDNTDDVQYHKIQYVDTGWHLDNDVSTVNIQIVREIVTEEE